jgi:serine phosphatase RsbU (regulator of sigma subunit)
MIDPAEFNDESEGEPTRLGGDASHSPHESPDEERVHYLLVVDGLEPGRRIPIGAAPFTVGRAAPSEVMLNDPEISRAHCRVERLAFDMLITDLGSTNGTFIDGKRVQTARIANGGILRIGRQLLRYELRHRREVAATEEMERDLVAARSYVESLLPARLTTGPIRTDWLFEPSARIGGDALGYHSIDEHHFALYVMDVAGHGTGAALHAASVINVMRKQALPGVDMREPGQVLHGLNAMFPMHEYGDMYFTAWYGVYLKRKRQLRYCSGGHHPGYLVGPARDKATPLETRNVMLGAQPDHEYRAADTKVVAGSMLYLFSDGVFEVETANAGQRGLDDFLPLLLAPMSGTPSEPERLVGEVRRLTRRGVFEDDLTLLVVTFP